eukprot:EC722037.1.p1 GENE.EC722037.1~~EC722037.1.p1  ORF type:complete len:185 (+),score=26.00 EC722037.1:35-556(+)
MSLKSVKHLILSDLEGHRILSKYFSDDLPTRSAQEQYEKQLFEKTQKTAARDEAEIILYSGFISVYKQVSDVWVYVSGGVDENEILLYFILSSVLDALTEIGKGSFDKQTLMDNMDMVFLAIDELLDSGIMMDTDGVAVASRVQVRGDDFGEQTLAQALQSARDIVVNVLQKL